MPIFTAIFLSNAARADEPSAEEKQIANIEKILKLIEETDKLDHPEDKATFCKEPVMKIRDNVSTSVAYAAIYVGGDSTNILGSEMPLTTKLLNFCGKADSGSLANVSQQEAAKAAADITAKNAQVVPLLNKKIEELKAQIPPKEDKKPDEKKPDEQKPDEKKPDDKKPDENKPDEKKPDEKQPDDGDKNPKNDKDADQKKPDAPAEPGTQSTGTHRSKAKRFR